MHAIDCVLNPEIINQETDVQPNGLDMRVNRLFMIEPAGYALLTENRRKALNRTRIMPWTHFSDSDEELLCLLPNTKYEFECDVKIRIPENYRGIVVQRSTLSRSGIIITSAAWDSGYEGTLSGQIHTYSTLYLQPNVRIAQFILAPATSKGLYSGMYQNKTTAEAFTNNTPTTPARPFAPGLLNLLSPNARS